MPFSKINPGTVLDNLQPSSRTQARAAQKRNRQSGKNSPPVSAAMRTWQKQCRIEAKKPIEEVVK